jgi:hypothetical protein
VVVRVNDRSLEAAFQGEPFVWIECLRGIAAEICRISTFTASMRGARRAPRF